MNQTMSSVARRDLLKGAGALIVSFAVPGAGEALAQAAVAAGGKPALHPTQLDSWLAIAADGKVTCFFGKMDMGQGVDVAIAQIVAEELDVPFAAVKVVMGDSALTVNQGGASGSTGVQRGGVPLRNAAAEARRLLLEMAGKRLDAPVDKLAVNDGIVTVAGDAAKKATYAELIGGKYFNHVLEWNKQWGNGLVATGKAKIKTSDQYKVVGKSFPRFDVPGKVFGTTDFVTDVKVPGMVHARVIRPPVAGAKPVAVDEASIREFPGARVVRKGDFLAVVTDKEWDSIKAAEKLKVTWSDAKPPFPPMAELYDHIRKTPSVKKEDTVNVGNVDAAFAGAVKVIEAEYEVPFNSHASMGPACAIVEIKDGGATLWTGTQKPHYAGEGVAKVLGIPAEKVHAKWIPGPGSYGRNDAGDAATEAAFIAQIVGKPVRVQGMRHEGIGWDPKSTPSVHKIRAGLDAAGNVIAWHFHSKGFPRVDVDSNESNPSDTWSGQMAGFPPKTAHTFGVPSESYKFAAKRLGWETIPPLLASGSPLRTSHLRDPLGPQLHFASEGFVDEVALAVNMDPVEFRLKYIAEPRDAAVIKAAAEAAKWKPRVGPNPDRSGNTLTGRGIAYAQRSGSVVAMVAEVEIDRRTGKIWARRFFVGHECGTVINPDTLRRVIEGNIVQGVSRTLWEEVQFDQKNVLSVDWETYPILDLTDTPESVESVLVDRKDILPQGAGEPSTRPIAAAVANAVFDATGVRFRRLPLTPARVKAAIG